jgi:hypothetical protein
MMGIGFGINWETGLLLPPYGVEKQITGLISQSFV